MSNESYEVIIAGGKLSGLLTAALLNARGVELLLLDDEHGHPIQAGGYEIDLQMFHPGKLSRSATVLETFDTLAINLSNSDFFSPSQPFFQVITDRHRLGFHGDSQTVEDEFEREFPEEAPHLLPHLWAAVERRLEVVRLLMKEKPLSQGSGRRAKIEDRTRSKGMGTQDQPLLERLEALSPTLRRIFFLTLHRAAPLFPHFPETGYFPLNLGNTAGYYPRGGMTGLKSLIKEKLRTFGVPIRPLSWIDRLIIRKQQVAAIALNGEQEMIQADALLYNADFSALHSLLPKSLFTKSFRDEMAVNRRWGRWRSLYLALGEDKLPVGMHDELVVHRESASPLIIQFSPRTDRTTLREGRKLLKVSTPFAFPKSLQDDSGESFHAFEQAVMKSLYLLIPFLGDDIEVIYRHDKAPPSTDDYLFTGPLKGPLNVGLLSPFTPYDNLFLAGKEIITTLGLEGDFLQARILADHISERLSRRGG